MEGDKYLIGLHVQNPNGMNDLVHWYLTTIKVSKHVWMEEISKYNIDSSTCSHDKYNLQY